MKNKITRYEELANRIIDLVSDVVEEQHPEISLNTTIARASGIQNPAVICGEEYYNLEDEIAEEIKNGFRRWKTAKKTSRKTATNKIKSESCKPVKMLTLKEIEEELKQKDLNSINNNELLNK